MNDQPCSSETDLFPALESNLLERILAPENLQTAWKQVRSNKGAPGVDGVTIEEYPKWIRPRWEKLRRALMEGYYHPQSVLRVVIPKPGGGQRLLGIPTVHDRVIQQAITQVLNTEIDSTFSQNSSGFRPGRNAHQAVKRINQFIKDGHQIAVDIDLSKFFDRVNHDILMTKLGKYIHDKRVMKLIGHYLRAGVIVDGAREPTTEGVPQGGPLSPLLANVMLDELDKYLESRQLRFARYADDFVICVKSSSRGHRVKQQVTTFLQNKLKLEVNEEKSAVRKSSELNFLGFTFIRKQIRWSEASLRQFKYRIRQLTGRSWGVSMAYRYHKLREYIQGWMGYPLWQDS